MTIRTVLGAQVPQEELEGGKIPSDSAGDVVLYAKIRTNKWTDLY